jgi:hypothetical protein
MRRTDNEPDFDFVETPEKVEWIDWYDSDTGKTVRRKVETSSDRRRRYERELNVANEVSGRSGGKGYQSHGFLVDIFLGWFAARLFVVAVPVFWYFSKWVLITWWDFTSEVLETQYFPAYLWSCIGISLWIGLEFLISNKWISTGIWLISFIFFGRFLIFH